MHEAPSDEDIAPLVAVWDATGHDVREVVRAILVSDVFYSEAAYRAKVRSPVQLVAGIVRGLEMETDFRIDIRGAGGMGQVLFDPPNVAGWPGGEAWLSSATLFARANFVDGLLSGFGPQDGPPARPSRAANAVTPQALMGLNSVEEMVDAALWALVDGNVPEASRNAIIEAAAAIDDESERANTVAYLVACSPEFQLV